MVEFTTDFLNRFPRILRWLSICLSKTLLNDTSRFFIEGWRSAGARGGAHGLMIRPVSASGKAAERHRRPRFAGRKPERSWQCRFVSSRFFKVLRYHPRRTKSFEIS
jgi:hypothetical protein